MNDFCVYPGYGVCQVLGEETKANQNFLKLKSFLLGDLTIFVPKNKDSLSRMRQCKLTISSNVRLNISLHAVSKNNRVRKNRVDPRKFP